MNAQQEIRPRLFVVEDEEGRAIVKPTSTNAVKKANQLPTSQEKLKLEYLEIRNKPIANMTREELWCLKTFCIRFDIIKEEADLRLQRSAQVPSLKENSAMQITERRNVLKFLNLESQSKFVELQFRNNGLDREDFSPIGRSSYQVASRVNLDTLREMLDENNDMQFDLSGED